MVRLSAFEESEQKHLRELPCPTYATTPFVTGVDPRRARVAVISTAGLHRRADRPFRIGESDYRMIPGDIAPGDLVMSHISTNFDRTGFQMDINMVLPLDRLREMERTEDIGSVADFHYSFMGATDPGEMAHAARAVAALLKKDAVDAALLVPV